MIKMDEKYSKLTLDIYSKMTEFISDQRRRTLTIRLYLICLIRSNKLGEGGFGSVYLLKNKLNKREIAAKFVDVTEFLWKADNIQHALKEARYLTNLDHCNIIKLESVFLLKKEIVLFTEYASGGELKQYLV